jgi:hypothetical protein
MVEPDPNKFHDHLDVCSQCRNQPLNLCPIGFAFLKEEALKGIPVLHLPVSVEPEDYPNLN